VLHVEWGDVDDVVGIVDLGERSILAHDASCEAVGYPKDRQHVNIALCLDAVSESMEDACMARQPKSWGHKHRRRFRMCSCRDIMATSLK
jgi:hypothetical protein